jgi:hypothetical protein
VQTWIPAFAGMTAERRDGGVGRDNGIADSQNQLKKSVQLISHSGACAV